MVDTAESEKAPSHQPDSERDRAQTLVHFQALLRALPDIYFRLNSDGRIVAWHAGREAELHVPPEKFLGQKTEDVVPPPVSSLIVAAAARARQERDVVVVEYSLSTPSGDDQFEARLVAIEGDEVTAIIRNTTARRRAEAALRATEERLRASQKLEAVGRLAGGIAHDFNNLLTVILGRLSFMKRSLRMDASDRDHVREALEAASRAASLTRQLLAFSRRQVLEPVVFSPNEIIEPLSQILRGLVGEHIELLFSLDPTVALIDADPTQFDQVVLNLVLNARDAMRAGGTLIVSTRDEWLVSEEAQLRDGAQAGPHVVLSVSDTGSGISSEIMAHLFEPFFTTKPQGEGTGLGLATVYGIAKQSGGHILVRSELGIGSTFELWFPRARRAGPTLKSRMGTSAAISPSGRGQRILVVEDEDGLRRLLVEILSNAGYTVRSASCGEDALRVVPEIPGLALLLTDVVMPKMNGRVLASRVQQLRPDVRVLLMSGHDNLQFVVPGDPSHAPQAPFPMIEKPFTEGALLARVRALLSDEEDVCTTDAQEIPRTM